MRSNPSLVGVESTSSAKAPRSPPRQCEFVRVATELWCLDPPERGAVCRSEARSLADGFLKTREGERTAAKIAFRFIRRDDEHAIGQAILRRAVGTEPWPRHRLAAEPAGQPQAALRWTGSRHR